jgi:hypothetical protein
MHWSLSAPCDFDLTGYTAAAVIDGLEADVSVTVTINELGANTQSVLSFTVANSVTLGWAGGVYTYRVILTAPSPSTETGVFAYGALLVLAPQALP